MIRPFDDANPPFGTLFLPFAAIDVLRARAVRLRGVESMRLAGPHGHGHLLTLAGEGAGPPVVLLHGLGSCAVDLVPLMEAFVAHHRLVIAPDLPGHGASDLLDPNLGPAGMVEQVVGVLSQIITEPSVVIGNSLGGLAAIRLAQRAPLLVRSLLLLSPAGAPMSEERLRNFLAGFQLSTAGDAFEFVDRFLARPNALKPFYALGVRARMNAPGTQRLLSLVRPDALLRPEELAALSVPVLVFWGESDRILPPDAAAFFRQNLPPQGIFLSAPRFGHAPYLDDLSGLVRRLQPWISEV